MVDNRQVRLALRNKVLTTAGIPAEGKRAYENRDFSPPTDGSVWLRERFVPVTERLVATELFGATGLYIIDVIVKEGSGTTVAEDLARMIRNTMKPQYITTPQVAVYVDRVEPRPGIVIENLWYVISSEITWRAYEFDS